MAIRLLTTIESLREELGLQGGLLDKEMLLHKAALEKLISASSPNTKNLLPSSSSVSISSSSSSSSPSPSPFLNEASSPSKRFVQFSKTQPLQTTSDSDLLSVSAPASLSSRKSAGKDENMILSTHGQQDTTLAIDSIQTENLHYTLPCPISPTRTVPNTTSWKNEGVGERTASGIELGRVTDSPPIPVQVQDPSVNEMKISVLSEEIRSLNR